MCARKRKKTKPIWAAPLCIHGMLEGGAGRQAGTCQYSNTTSAHSLERFILRTDQESGRKIWHWLAFGIAPVNRCSSGHNMCGIFSKMLAFDFAAELGRVGDWITPAFVRLQHKRPAGQAKPRWEGGGGASGAGGGGGTPRGKLVLTS